MFNDPFRIQNDNLMDCFFITVNSRKFEWLRCTFGVCYLFGFFFLLETHIWIIVVAIKPNNWKICKYVYFYVECPSNGSWLITKAEGKFQWKLSLFLFYESAMDGNRERIRNIIDRYTAPFPSNVFLQQNKFCLKYITIATRGQCIGIRAFVRF